jgi:hypothetical protein
MAILLCLLIALLHCEAAPGIQAPTPAREAGYVVEAVDATWEAVPATGAARALRRGSGIWPGDVVRLRDGASPPADPAIAVVLFSTGRIVRLAPGAKVDASAPARPGPLQRLLDAVRQRLAGETLVPGTVRSGALVHDAVVVETAGVRWRTIAPDLAAGPYTARFRPLNASGRAAGEWTALEEFQVAAGGYTPEAAKTTLRPGLWQVAVSHAQVPSIAGDGWLVITGDAAALAAFESLNAAMSDSLKADGIDVQAAVVRARRAAMLALVEGPRTP